MVMKVRSVRGRGRPRIAGERTTKKTLSPIPLLDDVITWTDSKENIVSDPSTVAWSPSNGCKQTLPLLTLLTHSVHVTMCVCMQVCMCVRKIMVRFREALSTKHPRGIKQCCTFTFLYSNSFTSGHQGPPRCTVTFPPLASSASCNISWNMDWRVRLNSVTTQEPWFDIT
jgi:hypothetical protein